MHGLFALAQGGDQRLDFLHRADIARHCHTIAEGRQLSGRLFTGLCLTGGDVDPGGAGLQKGFGHEVSEAAGTAGDYTDLTSQGKQSLGSVAACVHVSFLSLNYQSRLLCLPGGQAAA